MCFGPVRVLGTSAELVFQALESRDRFVIMGVVTISAVITLFGYLLADIVYVLVDPRIRYE